MEVQYINKRATSYQSASGKGKAAIGLIIGVLFFSLMNIVFSFLEVRVYSNYSPTTSIDHLSDAHLYLLFFSAITQLLSILVLLVTIVFFCIWIYAAMKNVHVLHQDVKYTPGWAVGWYFIPLANVIMPYYVMKEMWNKLFSNDENKRSMLIVVWWASYVTSNFIANRLLFSGSEEIVETFRKDAITIIFSEAALIIAGLCLIKIISSITKKQDADYSSSNAVV